MATPIVSPLAKTVPTATPFGGFDMSFLGSTTFWTIVVVGGIFGIILFFWILQREKKPDPFLQDYKIKKNQCKLFKDIGIKDVFIENNQSGLQKVGMYEGDCIDKEGYRDILISRFKFGVVGKILRKILFFTRPILDLILKKYWIVRCNVNPILVTTNTKVDKNNKSKTVRKEFTIPVPNVVRGKDTMIIHCEGLQLKKYYTYPILKAIDGSVIKDDDKNFLRERDSVLIDTLYQQTVDFSNVSREIINLNPNVRYVVKTEGKVMPEQSG